MLTHSHWVHYTLFPGNKVLVRCLRLLKPYTKKGVHDDDVVDDEDDEDDTEAGRAPPPEGRLMERDMLSQAYRLGRSDHFPPP